jgi:methyl-accepting chemotaxis protein
MTLTLESLRRHGLRWIAILGWMATLGNAMLSLLLVGRVNYWMTLLEVAASLVSSRAARCGVMNRGTRVALATTVVVHPAALVAMMTGHPFQIDTHLSFLAMMTPLAMLCDWRALVLTAALITLHHLAVALAAPDLAFLGGAPILRLLIHVSAVWGEALILASVAFRLRRLLLSHEEQVRRSVLLVTDADAARDRAEKALAHMHVADAHSAAMDERQRIDQLAAATRRAELLMFATRFEGSVARVTRGVSEAAAALHGMARTLDTLSTDMRRRTTGAASAAGRASETAQAMAWRVTQLSGSVGAIAASVHRHATLSDEAGQRSIIGNRALRALADRSGQVNGFVGTIRAIAAQTNLLAINATIEAARSGDAERGFAVVAQEVKGLAGQASNASQAMVALIAGIDAGTDEAESAFGEIRSTITELSGVAGAIRAAIDAHGTAAEEIERSTALSAETSGALASELLDLAHTAEAANALAGEVQDSAGVLLHTIGALHEATNTFVEHLRAA